MAASPDIRPLGPADNARVELDKLLRTPHKGDGRRISFMSKKTTSPPAWATPPQLLFRLFTGGDRRGPAGTGGDRGGPGGPQGTGRDGGHRQDGPGDQPGGGITSGHIFLLGEPGCPTEITVCMCVPLRLESTPWATSGMRAMT